ncbi:MAG: hypothetical protein AAF587_42135 [Bacteroidota bacterium]
MSRLILLFCAIVLVSCGPAQTQHAQISPSNGMDFKGYWYQGKAEVASYKLEQARYGEMRDGHAVLVFVTEDFSQSKQVKLDDPRSAGKDKLPILKLNFVKKFLTGIYPYSIMQSVFTPVQVEQYPHSLKTSMSSQEWCGHTYTQFNLQKNAYRVSRYSYFESEGDISETLPLALLEDEIWNLIRLAPEQLPTGTQEVIPGSIYSRLVHREQVPQKAKLSLSEMEDSFQYSIDYLKDGRSLRIDFAKEFPYKILGWEESYSNFGRNMTSKATLMKTLHTAYWSQHGNADLGLRKELGLE